MLFVYLMEEHPQYASRVAQIHRAMEKRGDQLFTSVFTLGEVLTGALKEGAEELAAQIKRTISPPRVTLLPFATAAAERFARIRAAQRVSPADAIHLACAAEAGVDLFLTNDRRLSGLVIPGIGFVAGLDVGLF